MNIGQMAAGTGLHGDALGVTLRIRAAGLSDCLPIAELHAASWRLAYRGALSDEYLAGDIVADRLQLWRARLSAPVAHQHVLVAEQDERMIGFACAFGGHSARWGSLLDNLHVAQASQRRGAGRLLLHRMAACCASLHADAGLHLWVLQSNANAQDFYARHGATNEGTDVWPAPGGTQVPRFRFSWQSLQHLQEATAHRAARGA